MLDQADVGASGFGGGHEHATRPSRTELRSTPKHSPSRAALFALLLATRSAAAERPEPVPLAPWSIEASLGGWGLDDGGVGVGAMGGGLQVGHGRGRWQIFAEGFAGYATADRNHVYNDGFATRGAGGVRWIARSFGFDGEAALELGLEASAGYAVTWWSGGTVSSRPDLQLGIDWQARYAFLTGHPRTIRFGFLTVFAPADTPEQMFACRGSCPAPARHAALARGLAVHMGFAW